MPVCSEKHRYAAKTHMFHAGDAKGRFILEGRAQVGESIRRGFIQWSGWGETFNSKRLLGCKFFSMHVFSGLHEKATMKRLEGLTSALLDMPHYLVPSPRCMSKRFASPESLST